MTNSLCKPLISECICGSQSHCEACLTTMFDGDSGEARVLCDCSILSPEGCICPKRPEGPLATAFA